ncbi:MAG: ribonuclease J [Magnetococcales bacterium]|nr:ribonuclease J [Magnetococcales bacterium]
MSDTANTPSSIQIIPLGGLGEIGMNLMVYEYAGTLMVVDCGITFPTPDTPGVDVIIPDFQYLLENKERVAGFVLTHGHEDHLGAMPYIWPRIQAPIYATPMTLGILAGKFQEHGLPMEGVFNEVNFRETISLGAFSVQFIRVTHSIIDGAALAISTAVGTIIHTGDFKIDHTPVDGFISDLYTLARYGEEGVLALLSDSTNVKRYGSSLSERVVRQSFEEIFPTRKGLLVVATFSSNIQRIRQVIEVARMCGRKVILNGRSMVSNTQVARALGYLQADADILIDIKEFNRYPRDSVLILSTGSQGETNSSLSRIVSGEHKEISLLPGDCVILSSKFIPGNERTIHQLINFLMKNGIEVIHEAVSEVHVSGHGSREDLKLMMALTRPRYFMPIHGETQHLHRHRALAIEMGIAAERTLVAENGDCVQLDAEGIRLVDAVPWGRIFVDGKGVGDVGNIVIRERRLLGEEGLVVVAMTFSHGQLISGPTLTTRGVIFEEENQELLDEARQAVLDALQAGPRAMDFKADEEAGPRELAQRALRRFFRKQLGRTPVVLPMMMEID